MTTYKISIIVTTYKWPDALGLVLDALNQQSYSNFEVIVADDGSPKSTERLVYKYKNKFKTKLYYVWHQDTGFRTSAIRNKAIAKSTGSYIIFLDGDCIPRRNFISSHIELCERGYFVTGNRILLSRSYTKNILSGKKDITRYSFMKWMLLFAKNKINRLLPLVTLPGLKWRYKNITKWQGAITCNMAAWKDDLLDINGFNEEYKGWGLEDSDLVVRLLNSGKKRKEGRYATGVFHLWHKKNSRQHTERNYSMLMNAIDTSMTFVDKGISKHQP